MRARARAVVPSQGMQVRVVGPDADHLSEADLRRLFPGSTLTEGRLDRLTQWSRCVAACGSRIVGVATYQCSGGDLRVPDIGVDGCVGCRESDIVAALLDALELACIVGGCQRIVLLPPPRSEAAFARQGFLVMNEGCGGLWLEKALS